MDATERDQKDEAPADNASVEARASAHGCRKYVPKPKRCALVAGPLLVERAQAVVDLGRHDEPYSVSSG